MKSMKIIIRGAGETDKTMYSGTVPYCCEQN